MSNTRVPSFPADPSFVQRWSPRSYTGEAIDEASLFTLFEAARWAPSGNNAQPWRFIYALRDTPEWSRLLGLLAERNQGWAHKAGALVLVISRTTRRRKGEAEATPLRSHAFDAGAAWMSFALQAQRLGWSTRAMGGFDRARARSELALPAAFEPQVVVAVGRHGLGVDPAEKANERLPLNALVSKGVFAFDEAA